jgi:hypothetical protein
MPKLMDKAALHRSRKYSPAQDLKLIAARLIANGASGTIGLPARARAAVARNAATE